MLAMTDSTAQLLNTELHSHTIYSKDCLTKLEELASLCAKKSIDRLAITDHNAVHAALTLAREYPALVIPGIEVMTNKGELLGYFISADVPPGLTPDETIIRLRDQGAIISVSHPFDRYRRGAWKQSDLEAIVDQVDAIEVFNARCLHRADNDRALAFAKTHGKLMTVGSDACQNCNQ